MAECQRRICEEGKIHFDYKCHKNDSNIVPTYDSNTSCGESQILLLNPYGEGTAI